MNNFKLDLLFKFLLCDEKDMDSHFLLKLLIQSLMKRQIHNLIVLNPQYLQADPTDKGVRYDIKCEDEIGNRYDIEMQNSKLSKTQIKRFGLYGIKLVSEDVYIGDDYFNLKQYIQIIFINDVCDDDPHLIEYYQPRTIQGLDEGHGTANIEKEDVLLTRIYIYLPYINEIVKENDLQKINDLKLMIYIIHNGITEKSRE